MNEYFCTIGPTLSRDIPRSNKMFCDFLPESNQESIFLLPTNEEELFTIINSLKNKKSPGYDQISNELIKNVFPGIVKPLVHIFNLSIMTGIVPIKMKIAKVVPIFKKGDPQLLNNYRPISLLTSFSKILEKIVYTRTIKFLNRNIILSYSMLLMVYPKGLFLVHFCLLYILMTSIYLQVYYLLFYLLMTLVCFSHMKIHTFS